MNTYPRIPRTISDNIATTRSHATATRSTERHNRGVGGWGSERGAVESTPTSGPPYPSEPSSCTHVHPRTAHTGWGQCVGSVEVVQERVLTPSAVLGALGGQRRSGQHDKDWSVVDCRPRVTSETISPTPGAKSESEVDENCGGKLSEMIQQEILVRVH
jgi:hypothetical protein